MKKPCCSNCDTYLLEENGKCHNSSEDDDQIEVECDGCGEGFPYDSLYITMKGHCCLSCFDDYLYTFTEEDN